MFYIYLCIYYIPNWPPPLTTILYQHIHLANLRYRKNLGARIRSEKMQESSEERENNNE